MRALIYSRVSQDRAEGRSPAEQEAESRALCAREGWEVAYVVTDSVGASRHSKGKRTGWQEVRDLVVAGRVDVLVTWEASRAQRDLKAYADLRDLCVRHGVLWSYSGRTHDLTTSADRFKTGLDALLAEREADETSERVQRAMRANATAGRPHGRRLYGYRRVYDPSTGSLVTQEPDPVEAPVVRRIFSDYLNGAGCRTIAKALNAEGVKTSTGNRWVDGQVKRVLQNAHYTGKRVHHGQVIPGSWEPVVDEVTFERVQARLEEVGTGVFYSPTARLLSAVATCGVCSGRMLVGHDRNGRKLYQCRNRWCVARDERKLDAYVTAVLLERMRDADLRAPATDPQPVVEARARVRELRARLADAVDQFTRGDLTAATLGKIETTLRPMIAAAETDVRRGLVPLDVAPPAGPLEDWWEGLDRETQRAVVGAWIAAVVVLPAVKGQRRFDPSKIVVEWRR